MDIVLENLCKSYGDHIVLNKFSAVIPDGQATAIMAPSGCGKPLFSESLWAWNRRIPVLFPVFPTKR